MSKIYLTIAMFLFSLFLFNCNMNNDEKRIESYQKQQHLKIKNNKIKSISIFEYEYTFGEVNKKGELFSITYYDTNGFETERNEHFNENGEATAKYFHTYDSTGKRISTIDELYVNNNEPYTKAIYRYNSLGNISESVDYYMDGDVAWKTIYNYNAKGLLDKVIVDDKIKYEYEYNSSNQLIKSIEYGTFFEKDYTEIWHYKYDKDKVMEALQYDESNEPYKLRKYEYQYY